MRLAKVAGSMSSPEDHGSAGAVWSASTRSGLVAETTDATVKRKVLRFILLSFARAVEERLFSRTPSVSIGDALCDEAQKQHVSD